MKRVSARAEFHSGLKCDVKNATSGNQDGSLDRSCLIKDTGFNSSDNVSETVNKSPAWTEKPEAPCPGSFGAGTDREEREISHISHYKAQSIIMNVPLFN